MTRPIRVVVLFGIVLADAAGCGTEADDSAVQQSASTGQQCTYVYTQTGVDCFAVGSATGPGDYPDIQCNDVYDNIYVCSTVEQATAPLSIYRSYNSTTGSHHYRTDPGLETGYVSEGLTFSLANDGYAGAVPFKPMQGSSGVGYYFPPSNPYAIPYLVPMYLFTNPARGDALYTLDPHGGSSLPCDIHGGPSGPPVVNCWLGGGIAGYVGRPCGFLRPGESLTPGQAVSSCDGRFHLVMQGDGNLVLYQGVPAQPMTALWATNTWGTSGQTAVMQWDGNFVLYDAGWNALWASNTWNYPGAYLAMQNDGNVVVYSGPSAPWSSQTCCR